MKKTTIKENLFVAEYMIHSNATKAALAMGASEASAGQTGFRMLKKAHIQAAIERGNRRALAKAEITKEMIVSELAKIAFSSIGAFIDVSTGEAVIDLAHVNGDELAAMQEITVDVLSEETKDDEGETRKIKSQVKRTKFKLYDKRAALNDLARMEGLFKDSLALTGKDGAPLPAMAFVRAKTPSDG